MQKLITQAAFALALAAGSTAAIADIAPKDLEVTGTIRTPSCTVVAENEGVYDYGMINMTNIPTSGHLQLSAMAQRWSVDCGEGTTFLGFQVTDNRAATASVAGNANFGLGSVEGFENSKIGYYTVTLGEAMIDERSAFTLKGAKAGASGTGAASTVLDKTQSHSWTDGTGTRGPMAGSKFDMTMTVQANIANKTTMGADITAGVPLDGHMTLVYSFGL